MLQIIQIYFIYIYFSINFNNLIHITPVTNHYLSSRLFFQLPWEHPDSCAACPRKFGDSLSAGTMRDVTHGCIQKRIHKDITITDHITTYNIIYIGKFYGMHVYIYIYLCVDVHIEIHVNILKHTSFLKENNII